MLEAITTLHGCTVLIPTLDHETTTGLPRIGTAGCTRIDATGETAGFTFVLVPVPEPVSVPSVGI